MSKRQVSEIGLGGIESKWRQKRVSTPLTHVPPVPGLYAFGHDSKRCRGLTSERVYMYIGESGNLRVRLGQHNRHRETNARLRDYLMEHYAMAICWFCPLPGTSKNTRVKLERELIRFFCPPINIAGKERTSS